MSDELTKVPVGLTTEGLLGKRYLAGIIDSILIAVLFGGLAGVVGALLGRTRAGPAIMHCCCWLLGLATARFWSLGDGKLQSGNFGWA